MAKAGSSSSGAPRRVAKTAAVRHLTTTDPVLAQVIAQVGPCRFKARAEGTHFDALVRSIVYQQISGKAAATILERVRGLFEGGLPEPVALLELPEATLRAAGLSRQKQLYLRDLAEHTASGRLPLDRIDDLPDEDVIKTLTAVKGVGRWTAEVFMMFRLARADVLPAADLGIQKAIQRAYRLRQLPKPAKVSALGAAWAPHRTVAAWYLWRSLDGPAAI
jgi:DNA-3-methyladenine glycosylase II